MQWKYHIPHQAQTGSHSVWEDIYLLPDIEAGETPSIWITIDTLGSLESPDHSWTPEEFQDAQALLGDANYHIHETDMLVRGTTFTRSEVVDWAKVWLEHTGFTVTTMVEAPLEEFTETNEHASFVASLKAKLNK